MTYMFLALLTGVFLVFTTTINSKIGTIKSVYISSFINFFMGIITAVIACFIFHKSTGGIFSFSEIYIYIGGFLAVFIVIISNYIIAKIGVFFATLLSVAGQLIMGTIIDWIRLGEFPVWPTVGGILIVLGLLYIHRVEVIMSNNGGSNEQT